MIHNLSLYQKILSWAIGIVIAILLITGAGTVFVVHSWLESDISSIIESESYDVLRSISFQKDSLVITSPAEWEEHHHQAESEIPIHIFLTDSTCNVVFSSQSAPERKIPGDVQFSTKEALFTTARTGGTKHRFITRPITHSGINSGWIVISMSYERVEKTTDRLIFLYLSGFSTLLVIVIFTSRLWVRQTLDSIQAISVKARNIQTRTLSERIPLPSHKDEIYHLAETLNGMLDRIENSLIATRRFFNNASHEIKTPLAIVVAQLEQLKSRKNAIEKQDLDLMGYEINRISKIIDDLGIISKADYTGAILKKDTLWLNDLVFDEILRFKPRADQKKVTMDYPEIPSMTLKGDENWIRILLSNILDNALKFAPENSTVKTEFSSNGKVCRLTVTDEGPGVPEEDLPLITKRFFRSDNAKDSSGSGLGLSIAQWVAEHHGGTLEFQNRDGNGLEVTWEFPAEN